VDFTHTKRRPIPALSSSDASLGERYPLPLKIAGRTSRSEIFYARSRQDFSFIFIGHPHLAFPPKKAIIRNRWKLKSRRDLKVLEHFQARAGDRAPTRNSPAVHDDILIIQCSPFLHKQGACAAGEVSVMRHRQGADCAASRSRRFSLFLTQAAERNCSHTDYADGFSVHSRFVSG